MKGEQNIESGLEAGLDLAATQDHDLVLMVVQRLVDQEVLHLKEGQLGLRPLIRTEAERQSTDLEAKAFH